MEEQAKELMEMMGWEERQKKLHELYEAIEKEQAAQQLDYERLKRQESELKTILGQNGIAETDIISGVYALIGKIRRLKLA